MESYNYFQSGKVGAVFVADAATDLLFMKAEVTPSLAVNSSKTGTQDSPFQFNQGGILTPSLLF